MDKYFYNQEIGFYIGVKIENEDIEISETEFNLYNGRIVNYVDGNFVINLEGEKLEKISQVKASINYEESVLKDGVYYVGGYDSAQKLDSKRRLAIESDETTVQYIDASDNSVILTLEEAKQVCLAVANDYEVKFYQYKTKKKEINNCKTIEELEDVEI